MVTPSIVCMDNGKSEKTAKQNVSHPDKDRFMTDGRGAAAGEESFNAPMSRWFYALS